MRMLSLLEFLLTGCPSWRQPARIRRKNSVEKKLFNGSHEFHLCRKWQDVINNNLTPASLTAFRRMDNQPVSDRLDIQFRLKLSIHETVGTSSLMDVSSAFQLPISPQSRSTGIVEATLTSPVRWIVRTYPYSAVHNWNISVFFWWITSDAWIRM